MLHYNVPVSSASCIKYLDRRDSVWWSRNIYSHCFWSLVLTLKSSEFLWNSLVHSYEKLGLKFFVKPFNLTTWPLFSVQLTSSMVLKVMLACYYLQDLHVMKSNPQLDVAMKITLKSNVLPTSVFLNFCTRLLGTEGRTILTASAW